MRGSEKQRAMKDVLLAICPVVLLFTVLIVWHFQMETTSCDDSWFKAILSGQPNRLDALGQYLVFRYNNWTSRLVSEIFAVTVTHLPLFWRIADALMLTAIPVIMLFLLGIRRENVVTIWAACACMVLYPLKIFGTAGWVTTTVFYVWPFFFGLIAMLPFSLALRDSKTPPALSVLCVPAALIACNNEQLCLLLLVVSAAVCGVVYIRNRRLPALLIVEVVMMLAMLAFVLTCPGNWNRVTLETATWFPEFAELSSLTKFEMGYASTGYLLVMERNWLFLLFCALLAANVWRTSTLPWSRAITIVPIAACLVLGVIPSLVDQPIPAIKALHDRLTEVGTGFSLAAPATWLPDALLLVVFACVVYSMVVVFCDPAQRFLTISLLLAGLATRVAIGFSPTIWASLERTAAFLYFALMALCFPLTERLCAGGGKLARAALTLVYVVSFCGCAAHYLEIFGR